MGQLRRPQPGGRHRAGTRPAAAGLEEEDEGEEDESRAGGFASLAGARITRDTASESGEDWGEEGFGDEDALELTTEAGEPAPSEPAQRQDELLLDADRLAAGDEAAPQAGRRRRLLGGGAEAPQGQAAPAKPAAGGSTLVERMANHSRAGTASADEEDEEGDEGSSSLRIPRFLGRQNNQ